MSESYPVYLRLEGRPVLVAGAGRVATRKIERLVQTGARVLVVAERASAPVRRLASDGRIKLEQRSVRGDDARGMFIVIAATDDLSANAALVQKSRELGALVSRVDEPADGDFTIPAMARGSHVAGTTSTDGAAPSASRRLARELKRWIDAGADRFAGEMAKARRQLRGRADASARLRELGDSDLYDACVRGDEARIAALLDFALGEPA